MWKWNLRLKKNDFLFSANATPLLAPNSLLWRFGLCDISRPFLCTRVAFIFCIKKENGGFFRKPFDTWSTQVNELSRPIYSSRVNFRIIYPDTYSKAFSWRIVLSWNYPGLLVHIHLTAVVQFYWPWSKFLRNSAVRYV